MVSDLFITSFLPEFAGILYFKNNGISNNGIQIMVSDLFNK